MSLQAVSAIVCFFLAQVAADTGVHFVIERHPDSYFCGHLQCVADFTKSDQDVSTFVEMTIYDITPVNSELKLASVSAFHPDDVYVDTTKSSAMSCTGRISRLQASLTLKLRHDIDCLYGVYKCQLDLVTESGHPEVLTEIVIPENNHNYTRVAEVISHIDELPGLFNIHTTLVGNQSTVINKLGSHLVDVTSQLMNQTAEIDRLGNHADHQITKLMDQTAEINKVGRQLDILTTGQMNHTAEINKLRSNLDHQTIKLTDQTANISKLLGSHLDHQITKLTDQTAEISKLGSHLDQQTTKLMNQTKEISKQGSRLDNLATQLAEQTGEINKLGSRLDHQTSQMTDQTAEINKLGSRLDHQTTQLAEQTDEINKLGSRLDHQTTQLAEQTDEINTLESRLDHQTSTLTDQTAEINKLGSRFDHQTTQLTEQTDEINKLGSRLDHQTTQLAEQTDEINTLRSRLDHQTSTLTDQTAEINKLGSRLDYQTTQLAEQTDEINKLGSRLDYQTTQLAEQTDEINKLGSRLDHQTIQLTYQTAEISKLRSHLHHQTTKLTDQTAEINKSGSRLEDLTAQLINQTALLHNMSQRLDLEMTKQKQQQLDTNQKPSIQIADVSQEQDTCIKGQPHRNGKNRITLWGNTTALCDTTTDGGGWIIIQRRSKGDVDFRKAWEQYKNGFGDLNTDFWIGNDVIHMLSKQGYNQLRIDLICEGRRVYAHYSNFSVASGAMNYQLTVGAFEGTADDSLVYQNNMYFSTFDRDNDKLAGGNCADLYKGAWWYNNCHPNSLNGLWGVHGYSGVTWRALTGYDSVSFSEMKVRRG